MKKNKVVEKLGSPRVANKAIHAVDSDVDPFDGYFDDAYAEEFSYTIDGVMYNNNHQEMY